MNSFLTALQFLTRINLVRQDSVSSESFGRSVKFFTLIGAIIGLILAAVDYIGFNHLPINLLATVLIVGEILLTGGLHCDGLMDTMDGVFSGRSRERMLEIMKDSRVGANGVMAFGLFLLVKWSLLVDVLPVFSCWILFVMPVLGRFAMVIAITVFPYARPEGIGKAFAEFAGRRTLIIAGMFALICLLPLGLPAVINWAVTGVFAIVFCRGISKTLGGLTGDVYGAVTEITELVVLAMFLLERKMDCLWF